MQRGNSKLMLPPVWLSYAVALACFVAVFDLPYGFYQFLRLVVTGYAGYLSFLYFQQRHSTIAWAFAFIALIYNPIFVIAMSKGVHAIFNLITVVLVLVELFKFRLPQFSNAEEAVTIGNREFVNEQNQSEAKDFVKFLVREILMIVIAIVVLGLLIWLGMSLKESGQLG